MAHTGGHNVLASGSAFFVKDSSNADRMFINNYGAVVQNVQTATSDDAVTNYGVTILPYSTVGATLTIDPPSLGVEKTLVVNSTIVNGTTTIYTAVYSGSTAIFFRTGATTTYTEYLYLGFAPPYTLANMVGLSTAEWGVISVTGRRKSSDIGSTQAVFSSQLA